MKPVRRKLTLEEWDRRYSDLRRAGLDEPWYGGSLKRHVLLEGDRRLANLLFDDSPASLRLWNFLLTENSRLAQARAAGEKLIGAMKDLGTVPVMAYSLPGLRAFYPDGAWWTPCLMECTDGLLQQASAWYRRLLLSRACHACGVRIQCAFPNPRRPHLQHRRGVR